MVSALYNTNSIVRSEETEIGKASNDGGSTSTHGTRHNANVLKPSYCYHTILCASRSGVRLQNRVQHKERRLCYRIILHSPPTPRIHARVLSTKQKAFSRINTSGPVYVHLVVVYY